MVEFILHVVSLDMSSLGYAILRPITLSSSTADLRSLERMAGSLA